MKRNCLLLVLLLHGACNVPPRIEPERCPDPDAKLQDLWQHLEIYCGTETTPPLPDGAKRCQQYQQAIENQALQCPEHMPSVFAGAVIAQRYGNRERAQQLLDRVLQRSPSQPDAAIMRIQIALEEGNVQYAERFSAEQILLAPDNPGLHEARAAALYIAGNMQEASDELGAAERLGAPSWRVAYHRGLLAEAVGNSEQAQQYYQQTLDQYPNWPQAASRLKALEAGLPGASAPNELKPE